jgi:hypothetical protein
MPRQQTATRHAHFSVRVPKGFPTKLRRAVAGEIRRRGVIVRAGKLLEELVDELLDRQQAA